MKKWRRIHIFPHILKETGFINPMAEGIVTSSFGQRKGPISGKTEFHNGIDIGASEGTEVVAVGNGRIIEVGKSPSYGNFVKYETTGNMVVMYAHLKKVTAEEGDFVHQGEKVAESGNTGYSTGPHLHYTIFKDGKETDPMKYIDYDVTKEVYKEYTDRGQAYG